jgi:hypothetical protein
MLDMVDEEQRVHTELTASGEVNKGYAPRLDEVNRRQALELEAVIEQYGWPGRSLVGEHGAHAAWFTLIHSIANPELMRKGLLLLKEAS